MVELSFLRVLATLILSISLVFAQDSKPTGPTHPNITKDCNAFHTAVEGDGCSSVETKYGISHANFINWNSDVSDNCLTNFWLGSSYCVGVGAVVGSSIDALSTSLPATTNTTGTVEATISTLFSELSSVTSSTICSNASIPYSIREPITAWNISSTIIESTFPPKKTQTGQSSYCTNWHFVVAGETCEEIVGSATWATMAEFLTWNPALGSDCSGLYDGWWVCIAVQPQSISVTFEYTITNTPAVVPDPTAWTPTIYTLANSSFIPTPTQAGIISDCKAFRQAENGETCKELLQDGLLSQEQLFSWNPALNGDCNGPLNGYYYCVAAADFFPSPPTQTTRPASIPNEQIITCISWYQVDGSETCDEIVSMFGGFSKDDFVEWNPTVGSDCEGINAEEYLCVGIPGTPPTRTTGVSSTTATPTAVPTQNGIVADCIELWLVSRSDRCSSIAEVNGISQVQLLAWNPALGTSTCTNLIPNFYICVAASGEIASTTIAQPTATSNDPYAPY